MEQKITKDSFAGLLRTVSFPQKEQFLSMVSSLSEEEQGLLWKFFTDKDYSYQLLLQDIDAISHQRSATFAQLVHSLSSFG